MQSRFSNARVRIAGDRASVLEAPNPEKGGILGHGGGGGGGGGAVGVVTGSTTAVVGGVVTGSSTAVVVRGPSVAGEGQPCNMWRFSTSPITPCPKC